MVKQLSHDWMLLRYFANRQAEWWPGEVFEITCSVNIKYYPFDTQKCYLVFIPHMYFSSELRLYSRDLGNVGFGYTENGEWEFL